MRLSDNELVDFQGKIVFSMQNFVNVLLIINAQGLVFQWYALPLPNLFSLYEKRRSESISMAKKASKLSSLGDIWYADEIITKIYEEKF